MECASHKLNLSVKDMLSEHDDLITKIHSIMVQLNSTFNCARLEAVGIITVGRCHLPTVMIPTKSLDSRRKTFPIQIATRDAVAPWLSHRALVSRGFRGQRILK
jgi:hypothetical protein